MTRIMIAALLALTFAPGATRAQTISEQQVVGGTIVVPAGAARAQRCARTYTANGTFGYIVDVTAGKLFSLTTPNHVIDDVNIGFYKKLTDCEAGAEVAGAYVNRFGNESGTVPPTATVAIIYTGSLPYPPEHAGYARLHTPFTYTQTNPPS